MITTLKNSSVFLRLGVTRYISQYSNMSNSSSSSANLSNFKSPTLKSSLPLSLLSERVKYTHDYARLATSNPLCAITLTVVMFSIAGIPPLAGFYSKAFLIFAAIGSANYVLSILAITMSVISAFYYIRIVKIMYFEPNMQKKQSFLMQKQSFYKARSNDSSNVSLPLRNQIYAEKDKIKIESKKNQAFFARHTKKEGERTFKKPVLESTILPTFLKKEFAYTMLSFTQISKEISLVCALSFSFLLFFSLHPKPVFLITQKALLLLT